MPISQRRESAPRKHQLSLGKSCPAAHAEQLFQNFLRPGAASGPNLTGLIETWQYSHLLLSLADVLGVPDLNLVPGAGDVGQTQEKVRISPCLN